jgi:hypothetical protein
VDTGFVMVQTDAGLQIETAVGQPELAELFVVSPEAHETWKTLAQARPLPIGQHNPGRFQRMLHAPGDAPDLYVSPCFWSWALYSEDGEKMLGVLAVRARNAVFDMEPDERVEANVLLAQAGAAISDRYVQEGVFAALQRILPDLERIQEWRSALSFAPPSPPAQGDNSDEPETTLASGMWQRWVKEALSHYWGGPKLTNSPLLGLNIMRNALTAQDGSVPRALRAVLQEAIERQRPTGDRKLTASEWLLYNILDMRFIQGQRVRDIASRLAISESDLYRKQRVAVAEVARTLAEMEEEIQARQTEQG